MTLDQFLKDAFMRYVSGAPLTFFDKMIYQMVLKNEDSVDNARVVFINNVLTQSIYSYGAFNAN